MISKARLITLLLCGLALAAVVLSRSAFLQIVDQPRLKKVARRQFVSRSLIRPRRGAILDRNGEQLAISVERFSLAANPNKVREQTQLITHLSRAMRISHKRLSQKFGADREFVWIKRHLADSDFSRLKKSGLLSAQGQLQDGLWFVRESSRAYPQKGLASHLLGSVNIDNEGIEGIELWFNESLRGEVISLKGIRDARGRPTFIDAEAAKDVQDGQAVRLTIDSVLQFQVEQKLQESMEKTGAESGSVIVMNAMNGEILAMTNRPTFHPDENRARASDRRNRAITDGYEPGSTMKTLLLATALENGFHLKSKFYGEKGVLEIDNHKITEAEEDEKFEWMTLSEMLKRSSNVVAAKLALKLGPEKVRKSLDRFGFGEKTGIGFPGEISGDLPSLEELKKPLRLANLGFGQGLLVTPIQMIRTYASFLNGGELVTPQIVYDPSQTPRRKRVISRQSAHLVSQALEGVVQGDGTGVGAAIPGFRIGGKTGTAQMASKTYRGYSRTDYYSSFVGFALEVEPRIVVYAALSKPKRPYYASETAVPLFQEVMKSVIRRYSLPSVPETPLLTKKEPDKSEISRVSDTLHVTFSSARGKANAALVEKEAQKSPLWEEYHSEGKSGWLMPSLKGLTAREAIQSIGGRPFELKLTGSGVVESQSPLVGRKLAEGASIRLRLKEP